MDLILGMDVGVFIAWLGTILATILCVLYGLYYQFFKKTPEEPVKKSAKRQKRKKQEEE